MPHRARRLRRLPQAARPRRRCHCLPLRQRQGAGALFLLPARPEGRETALGLPEGTGYPLHTGRSTHARRVALKVRVLPSCLPTTSLTENSRRGLVIPKPFLCSCEPVRAETCGHRPTVQKEGRSRYGIRRSNKRFGKKQIGRIALPVL